MSFASASKPQSAPPSQTTSKGKLPTRCACNLPLARRVSHTGSSNGREYLHCIDKPVKNKGCDAFYWVHEYDAPSSQGQASVAMVTTASPSSSQPKHWSGTTPMKRKRSESPSPTKPPSDSTAAVPPPDLSSQPLYTTPDRPSKRSKANLTSEDELWEGVPDDDSNAIIPQDSTSKDLAHEEVGETPAATSNTNHSRPLNVEMTPKRNPEVSYGLVTPISNAKPPGPQDAYNTTEDTPRPMGRDLGKGPILEEDSGNNPFLTSQTRKGKEPETPRTPSGLLRTDSGTLISDLYEAVKKVEKDNALKDRQKIAAFRSLERRDARIKQLESELAEKDVNCNDLRRQLETALGDIDRLRALLGGEGSENWDILS